MRFLEIPVCLLALHDHLGVINNVENVLNNGHMLFDSGLTFADIY